MKVLAVHFSATENTNDALYGIMFDIFSRGIIDMPDDMAL